MWQDCAPSGEDLHVLGCDKPTLELLAEMVNGVMMGDEEADQVAIVASKPPAMQLKLVRVLRACSPQAWARARN